MSFLEICAQYKKIRFHSKSYVWSAPNTKKMVPFKKILSQIMNGLHTNHLCSMGTIMKFVIYMEVLDADLERIYNRLAFSRGGTCYSPPRRIAPKPSVRGIAHGLGMTPARSGGVGMHQAIVWVNATDHHVVLGITYSSATGVIFLTQKVS